MTRGRLFGVELPVRKPIRLDERRVRRSKEGDDRKREHDGADDKDGEAGTSPELEVLAEKLARYG